MFIALSTSVLVINKRKSGVNELKSVLRGRTRHIR